MTRIDDIGLRMLIAERRGIPRVHGNGFIQLDIEPDTRLHVWGHRSIPKQQRYTGIHDHVFSFSSTALLGRVFQIPYVRCTEAYGRYYRIFEPVANEGEDTKLVEREGEGLRLEPAGVRLIDEGNSYYMKAGHIHETVADGPAATLMRKRKGERLSRPARVFVQPGVEPDNEFNRHSMLSVESMWRIIEDVMARPL